MFDGTILYATAVFTVAYQLMYFFIAYYLQIDKVTDFAGGSNFAINCVIALSLSQNSMTSKKLVAACCVFVWAVRLALFLLIRVLKAGDDKRFDEMRQHFFQFLGFWVFQMFWVYLVGFSVVLLISSNDPAQFGSARDIAGLSLFVIGFVIEAVADQQKFHYRFNTVKQYKESHDGRSPPIIQSGMWYWSRQPNYYGEIMLWWGLFVLCLTDDPISYSSFISPVFTTLLLLFLSGIPLSEKGSQKRYMSADNKDEDTKNDYIRYRNSTSPLIIMPPALYSRLPLFVKRMFFFEFPMYEGPQWKKLTVTDGASDSESSQQQ